MQKSSRSIIFSPFLFFPLCFVLMGDGTARLRTGRSSTAPYRALFCFDPKKAGNLNCLTIPSPKISLQRKFLWERERRLLGLLSLFPKLHRPQRSKKEANSPIDGKAEIHLLAEDLGVEQTRAFVVFPYICIFTLQGPSFSKQNRQAFQLSKVETFKAFKADKKG